ncbi:MAG TPA: DNA replication and repair protein RecF [Candidatus Dormibacteraeota bacterium]|nr:DNA replication and repair protein RecF [Candidatus Dormibacteraeota bacterium]
MLTSISLYAFRNYLRERVPLRPGVNLFLGANAQGKTNLLEAIYAAATGRSPRSATLGEMVMWEQTGGRVVLEYEEDGRAREIEVRLERDLQPREPGSAGSPASQRTKRTVRLDQKPLAAGAMGGMIKVVLFHPEEMTLIRGSGEGRRRLLNGLLSQAEPGYSGLLTRYGRIVEQRNQLLKRVAEDLEPASALDWWTDEAGRIGGEIVAARRRRLAELAPLISACCAEIAGGENLDVRYAPSVDDEADPGAAIRDELRARRREELARGMTVAGPHRDDLEFLLGGMTAASHASQGQQRTAILAFKLAEVRLLAASGTPPVLLLDDVMSELDAPRRRHLLEVVEGSPQTVITTAEEAYFPAEFLDRVRPRRVVAGALA